LDNVFNNEAKRTGAPDSEGQPVAVKIESRAEVSPSRVLQCTDPARAEIFHELTCAGPEEVDRAINAATLAWAMWRGTDIKERLAGLKRLAGLIREQAPIISELIAREMGRPASEALALEILPALDYLNYLTVHAEDAYVGRPIQPRHVFHTHKRVHYLYEPYGIIAVVTPYSIPFALPLAQVAAALAMGNAVLLKPSELTPLCGMKIGELCRQAGLPEGLVQVLPMKKEDALFLVSHPGVDKIFVTGSPETGRQVMAIAGCIPKPVVLSLGSKNPAVVANDADLERTARGIVWGSMVGSGQHCDAIERVYVTEAIASRFVEKVLVEADKLVTGNPMDSTVDLGPLISAWRRNHVHSQVTDAVARGGQLLRGGHLPEEQGFFTGTGHPDHGGGQPGTGDFPGQRDRFLAFRLRLDRLQRKSGADDGRPAGRRGHHQRRAVGPWRTGRFPGRLPHERPGTTPGNRGAPGDVPSQAGGVRFPGIPGPGVFFPL
jgi:acyl-CoA reductase-like NAD-dependent aldehyde dehydrogenase